MAIEDANNKAEILAEASDRKLGKIINVSEEGSSVNYSAAEYRMDSLSSKVPVEAGSSLVSKRLRVVFELK